MFSRRAFIGASQGAIGAPSEYAWFATIAEAQLHGGGQWLYDGSGAEYSGSYTFPAAGYYRIYAIGKGGDGGDGGDGSWYVSGTGARYAATGGSGASGGYGGCTVYELFATAGASITLNYSPSVSSAVVGDDSISANSGSKGGAGTDGNAFSGGSGGLKGTAGVGGNAAGSNIDGGNIVGVSGIDGVDGTSQFSYGDPSLAAVPGANTAVSTSKYLNGGAMAGGSGAALDGANGAYSVFGAETVLGNPGAGGAGGAGTDTYSGRAGGLGGRGAPGGFVIEKGS